MGKTLSACGPHFAAIHVRRTDLYTAIPASQHTSDADFDAFADAAIAAGGAGSTAGGSVGKVKLYVATDNADTQKRLKEQQKLSLHKQQLLLVIFQPQPTPSRKKRNMMRQL